MQGEPEAWRAWWEDAAAKTYYFIGKDNIPFHTIIWPAILMAYGGLNLPTDVPANQYVTFKGAKASKSEGVGASVLTYLERYQPDAIRYALAANMPETSDTDLTEAEMVRRINDELVATWGNLVNRVLQMTHRTFDGAVPRPGALDARDEAIIAHAEAAVADVASKIERVQLKAALAAAMAMTQEANAYLNDTEPWKTAKTDRERTATSLYVALCVIDALKTAFYPYLPFSSRRVHEYLGYGDTIEEAGWSVRRPAPGTPLVAPEPLFRKVELSDAETA
jgi:methionyl-tRNA synthetase